MKRVFAIFLVVVLLVTLAVPAFAAVPEDNQVYPMYAYITKLHGEFSIDTNTGISSSYAYLFCYNGYIAEVQCELQRYSGGNWSTIKTWTSSGSQYAVVDQDWAVLSGYNYRLCVTYRVKTTGGVPLEITNSTHYYNYPKN